MSVSAPTGGRKNRRHQPVRVPCTHTHAINNQMSRLIRIHRFPPPCSGMLNPLLAALGLLSAESGAGPHNSYGSQRCITRSRYASKSSPSRSSGSVGVCILAWRIDDRAVVIVVVFIVVTVLGIFMLGGVLLAARRRFERERKGVRGCVNQDNGE